MTKNEIAELVDFIGKKFDAQKRESERRFDALERRFDGLETRFDRFELIFRADRLDVQQRLKALEN